MTRRWGIWIFFYLVILSYGTEVLCQESDGADEIKAAYIYNIIKFTSWPDTDYQSPPNETPANESHESPLNVCLSGTPNSVAMLLADKLRGRTAKNKSLAIVYIPEFTDSPDEKTVQALGNCTLLYMGATSPNQEAWLINYSENHSILTISDSPDFSKRNGIVELKTDIQQEKVFILINTEAARKTNIVFSSKLLQLAHLVNSHAQ